MSNSLQRSRTPRKHLERQLLRDLSLAAGQVVPQRPAAEERNSRDKDQAARGEHALRRAVGGRQQPRKAATTALGSNSWQQRQQQQQRSWLLPNSLQTLSKQRIAVRQSSRTGGGRRRTARPPWRGSAPGPAAASAGWWPPGLHSSGCSAKHHSRSQEKRPITPRHDQISPGRQLTVGRRSGTGAGAVQSARRRWAVGGPRLANQPCPLPASYRTCCCSCTARRPRPCAAARCRRPAPSRRQRAGGGRALWMSGPAWSLPLRCRAALCELW